MIGPLEDLTRALARLPGLGRRSASRAALALLREPEKLLDPLSWAMRSARESVVCCSRCGAFTVKNENPCSLCTNALRDGSVLCIVEEPADIIPIESSGAFH
ncbi:MAG: recombination protein RecR, partial [Kiritimatiellae bacterium]|nr:recombination protein RecR [Kiritimatiellia bacterium]